MPIEIRELQINVTVNQTGDSSGAPAAGTGSDVSGKEENKNIISQCIEQVMEILNNKKER